MVIAALTSGAMIAVGVLVLWRALRPAPAPLAVALARLREPSAEPIEEPPGDRVLFRQLVRLAMRVADGAGVDTGRFSADLRLLGKSPEQFAAHKILMAAAGFAVPLASEAIATVGGAAVPLMFSGAAAVLCAIGGFFLPNALVRAEAAARRRDFRHALSAFLDLVAIKLAGGAGPEGALRSAMQVGDGWQFALLRRALETTRSSRETPWDALARLGHEIALPELQELAASVSLAGTEGAKIRASLSAKAAALRQTQISIAEAEAQAASERMSLPVVLLFLGFLVFIGYPAVSRITGL